MARSRSEPASVGYNPTTVIQGGISTLRPPDFLFPVNQ